MSYLKGLLVFNNFTEKSVRIFLKNNNELFVLINSMFDEMCYSCGISSDDKRIVTFKKSMLNLVKYCNILNHIVEEEYNNDNPEKMIKCGDLKSSFDSKLALRRLINDICNFKFILFPLLIVMVAYFINYFI